LARSIDSTTRASHPCVACVNRYDWGYHGVDRADSSRTIADIDPEEWQDAWARKWQMYLDGVHTDKFHQDHRKWERIGEFSADAAFFVDAAKAPEVVKTLARYVT